jgi:hypothetical protein
MQPEWYIDPGSIFAPESSWVLPKNGDVPRSPLPENGSLIPSAGTIFNLKIDFGSYHRNGGTREH